MRTVIPAARASRREFLVSAAGATTAAAAAGVALTSSGPAAGAADEARPGTPATPPRSPAEPFRYSLNCSTIRGQNLTLDQEFEVAAGAGYDGIEPWLPKIHEFAKGGGSLTDLAKRAKDLNLAVPSSIGFAEWIVDDDNRRAKGLEQAKRDMEAVRRLGGLRTAAPAIGAQKPDAPLIDLRKVADRYRTLCEIGRNVGVVPECEVWGFSPNLTKLADAAFVAVESGHPDACVLADVYHLHKGGSPFEGLRQLNGRQFQVLHVNDYPVNRPRARIADKDRIYPGDGVAPLDDVFRTLRDIGFTGFLSLELFNEEYWKQDALQVAKTGLEKTRAAVRKALG
jgi:2-keto-myo-inositol isomerase